MSTIKAVEQAIEGFSAEEMSVFRSWFMDFDQQQWDHQIVLDVQAGKLDQLAQQAILDHQQNKSREL